MSEEGTTHENDTQNFQVQDQPAIAESQNIGQPIQSYGSKPNMYKNFAVYLIVAIAIVAVLGGSVYYYIHTGVSNIKTTSTSVSTSVTTIPTTIVPPTTTIPNNISENNTVFGKILNASNVLYGVAFSSEYNTSIETYPNRYKNISYYVYRRFYGLGGLYRAMAYNSLPNQAVGVPIVNLTQNGTYPTAIKVDILVLNNSNTANRTYKTFYYPVNGTGYFYFNRNGTLIYNSTGTDTASPAIINESYYNTSIIGAAAALNGSDTLNGMVISTGLYGKIFRNYYMYQISVPPYRNMIIVVDAYFPTGKVNERYVNEVAYRLYLALEANYDSYIN